MPTRKRKRREPTHEWQEIEQLVLWPEQEAYERLRPVILFGQTAAERAKETGASERTLHYQAKLFEQVTLIRLKSALLSLREFCRNQVHVHFVWKASTC